MGNVSGDAAIEVYGIETVKDLEAMYGHTLWHSARNKGKAFGLDEVADVLARGNQLDLTTDKPADALLSYPQGGNNLYTRENANRLRRAKARKAKGGKQGPVGMSLFQSEYYDSQEIVDNATMPNFCNSFDGARVSLQLAASFQKQMPWYL